MKKITYVLLALLVCATLIGTASAFTYTNGAVVDPSGSLSPGEAVTASMTIVVPEGTMSSSASLKLTTALHDSALWTIYVYKGSYNVAGTAIGSDALITTLTSSNWMYTISGFVLDYGQDITLYIVVSGLVPDDAKGQSVTIMKIVQDPAPSSGYSTYSSPVQSVYNPDDLSSQITATESEITTLESRIAIYSSYGIDVSAQVTNLQSAKTSLAAAKSAGTADIVNANKYLEAATTTLSNIDKALSLAGLTKIKANTDAVDLIVTELYGKGWDTEAKLLATTNQGIKNTYDVAALSYNAGGSPNVDENLKASEQAVADGNAYLEKASASPLAAVGSVLPIIIVIVVAVVVVFGAIVFIRRRRGGWDELG
jgi:hypothetical protein